jgi:hypothetical protein
MTNDKIINLIDLLIDYHEEDTKFPSKINKENSVLFVIVKLSIDNEKLVISTILKRMREKTGWFYLVLHHIIVPKQEHPKTSHKAGQLEEQTKIWLEWGKEKGYVE